MLLTKAGLVRKYKDGLPPVIWEVYLTPYARPPSGSPYLVHFLSARKAAPSPLQAGP